MDDMELISAESKATRNKFKTMFRKKLDLKVSTMYIAQVKKKHGLVVKKYYNNSKNDNQNIS